MDGSRSSCTIVQGPARQSEADRIGLSSAEAAARLREHGPNVLPTPRPVSLGLIFLRQFLSPLIYILLAAALVSAAASDIKDAVFIAIVLTLNWVIGTIQEYSAERAAAALRDLQALGASVIRNGFHVEIDARMLVPGDVVLLEAGAQVPADIDLRSVEDLHCDESLLTGESRSVAKRAATQDAAPDGGAVAFAGTLVTRGRALGVVTATGRRTEVGRIASLVSAGPSAKPPLMIRLEIFSRRIALFVGVSIAALLAVGVLRGIGAHDLFLLAVGLAVSAIPEGLPVAISVALAIGMRRMAGENVLVRNLPAIEALGSCTMIATDKTGTLTMNELTVTEVRLPDGTIVEFEPGNDLDACRVSSPTLSPDDARARSLRLLRAATLPNEAVLRHEDGRWTRVGDTVDLALLAAARKVGFDHAGVAADHPMVGRIPYEPARKFAASFHQAGDRIRLFVKGAPETVIAMSDRMQSGGDATSIDRSMLLLQKEALAAQGFRVLAFAEGEILAPTDGDYGHHHLIDLVFLGLAAMRDPIRPEVPDAVSACRTAGIDVAMLTGDDSATAAAIATGAGLVFAAEQIVDGEAVRLAEEAGEDRLDQLTRTARIFARIAPVQKLAIVQSMARNGHFVAVTGDGVNDAPALKHAHVGVAMGKKGTAVARESADIIITDDNFASVVAGIRQGRIAYANIRKVVFMLVSTGAAEVLLFLLTLPLGLPMPLLPVQLLWLNLVTNGMQDVFLAAEKAEGDELALPPRSPREPVFDRLMLRRVLHATVVMGGGGFIVFWWLIESGRPPEEARNLLLLLFVLFENIQTFNSRSERRSIFAMNPWSNTFLIVGVLGAQVVHVLAMYLPVLRDMLALQPVSLSDWALLAALASSILLTMELDKWLDHRRTTTPLSA
jgi:P-type Ca2+ transporter type 2C